LVPVIVGTGGVANVPAATTTVDADVFGVSPLPDFCHVTVTLMNLVTSLAANAYVLDVASVMFSNTPVAVVARDH
jgi:hypothetical protein